MIRLYSCGGGTLLFSEQTRIEKSMSSVLLRIFQIEFFLTLSSSSCLLLCTCIFLYGVETGVSDLSLRLYHDQIEFFVGNYPSQNIGYVNQEQAYFQAWYA